MYYLKGHYITGFLSFPKSYFNFFYSLDIIRTRIIFFKLYPDITRPLLMYHISFHTGKPLAQCQKTGGGVLRRIL